MARQGRTVLRQVETIDADPDVVRGLLVEPRRWAPLLPHVQLVDVLDEDEDHSVVRLSARRLWWWPVTLLIEVQSRQRGVTIRHLDGAGKGTVERWTFEPVGDGRLRLQLQLDAPNHAARLRSWLIVAPLEARTFQMIAMLAEAEQQVDRAQHDPDYPRTLPRGANHG